MSFKPLAVFGFSFLLLGSNGLPTVKVRAIASPAAFVPQETPAKPNQDDRAPSETADKETSTKGENEEKTDDKPDNKIVLDGTFVAANVHSIRIEPKEWTDYTILSIVDHGTNVSKGDTLIQFDPQDLQMAIRDAEIEQQLERLSLENAEDNLELLRKTSPLELAEQERAEHNATEDLKRFLALGRQQTKKSLEFSVQSAENRLAYQEEELRQLEKMYEADEITEETEEIILRRTRDEVETARFALERAKEARDKGVDIDLRRTEEQLEKSVTDAAEALEKARLMKPREIRKEEISMQKARIAREKNDEKLDRLRQDRRLMTVTAPAAGTVYYGDIADGSLSGVASAMASLRPGQAAKAKQALLTIVQQRPLLLHAKLAEKDLSKLRQGDTVCVKPTAFPEQELSARVMEISKIPVGPGQFALELSVDVAESMDGLVPGMTAKIEFSTPSSASRDSPSDSGNFIGSGSPAHYGQKL